MGDQENEQETNEEEIPATEQEANEEASAEGLSGDPSQRDIPAGGEAETGETGTEDGDGGAFKAGKFYEERQERKLDRTQGALREAEAKLAEVTRQTEAAQLTAPVTTAPKQRPMPTLEDHDYDSDAHQADVSKWVDEQMDSKLVAFEAKREKQKADGELETMRDEFRQRENVYADANPEYKELYRKSQGVLEPSDTVLKAIVASENGPAVYHALMSDPKRFLKMNEMSDVQALMAFGSMENEMSLPSNSKKNPAQTTKSKLPKPIENDVGGGGSVGTDSSVDIHEAGISTEEYARRESNLYARNHPS